MAPARRSLLLCAVALVAGACGKSKPLRGDAAPDLAVPVDSSASDTTDATDTADATDAADAGTETPAGRCVVDYWPPRYSTACDRYRCGDRCATACVDLQRDPANCGTCGHACLSTSPCVDGVCGAEAKVVVPAASGCLAMRLVYDGGYLYWGNLHAGTISRRSVAGGPVEVVAKDLLLAALFPWPLAVDVWSGLAPFVVRDGTVYWIAADSPAVSSAPPDGQPRGGSGTKIMAVSPAGESRPLLPVLSRQFGPIRAVALSPDGGTLYFAEGSSFFAIPSAGASTAAEIRPLGTVRLANDAATVLVADERHLFYPTGGDGWVEGIDFTQVCTKNADGQPTSFGCANWIGGSHAHPLMDTLQVLGSDLYWANGPSMCVGKTEAYITFDGLKGPPAQCWDVSGPVFADVSGFVATPTKVFFGADGMIGEMITKTGTTRLLARDQPHPTSLVTDGKQVYWVTPDCSIATVPAE